MNQVAEAVTIVGGGILVLLILILYFRIQAFLSLLTVSVGVALLSGIEPRDVFETIKSGMGGTLGFVAVVVGLGAMLGTLLEVSGGIQRFSHELVGKFGDKKSQWTLNALGLLIAIPIFLDVALIILVPLLYGLAREAKRPILYFALPLLAGMAVAHSFIPPTPGPVAVAEILGANLGLVIILGAVAGIPAAIVAGPVFTPYALKFAGEDSSIDLFEPSPRSDIGDGISAPSVMSVLLAILLPLALIVLGATAVYWIPDGSILNFVSFIGHPFTALIVACFVAYIVFGIKAGVPSKTLQDAMAKSMGPAGVVVLITGAGGAFKQVLIDSNLGITIGEAMASASLTPIVFAFLVATIVRTAQGSATVAMITAAGLTAPILQFVEMSDAQLALVVIAISSGATMFSHVNDSGFWLVSRYLGLSENQTLRSWTIATTLVGLIGFAMTLSLSLLL